MKEHPSDIVKKQQKQTAANKVADMSLFLCAFFALERMRFNVGLIRNEEQNILKNNDK